jgi:hypothetical protein
MATTVLRQSPCSKNWKPYKIETKDSGIQVIHAVLQLSVGYRPMALVARRWGRRGGERDDGGREGGAWRWRQGGGGSGSSTMVDL